MIVDLERHVDAFTGPILPVTDSDRSAVPLVNQIAREYLSVVRMSALERRVGNCEFRTITAEFHV